MEQEELFAIMHMAARNQSQSIVPPVCLLYASTQPDFEVRGFCGLSISHCNLTSRKMCLTLWLITNVICCLHLRLASHPTVFSPAPHSFLVWALSSYIQSDIWFVPVFRKGSGYPTPSYCFLTSAVLPISLQASLNLTQHKTCTFCLKNCSVFPTLGIGSF